MEATVVHGNTMKEREKANQLNNERQRVSRGHSRKLSANMASSNLAYRKTKGRQTHLLHYWQGCHPQDKTKPMIVMLLEDVTRIISLTNEFQTRKLSFSLRTVKFISVSLC